MINGAGGVSYRIKNWDKFQHFKDRRPPWIKLYRDLLDDPDWFALSGNDAKNLTMLWLIASEDDTKQGLLPSAGKIAFRLRISLDQTKQLLIRLSQWVLQDDITAISSVYQVGPPETETYREETETELSIKDDWPEDFRERFWRAYPRRIGKTAAIRKLEVVRRSGEISFARLLCSVGKIDTRDEKFIPHPTTWLNQGRYLDSEDTATPIDDTEFARLKAEYDQKIARSA